MVNGVGGRHCMTCKAPQPPTLIFVNRKLNSSSLSREWRQRSIFWMGLLLVYDFSLVVWLFVRKLFGFQIIIPAGSVKRLYHPPPSQSSLDVHLLTWFLALRLPASIIYTACLSENFSKTGQPVQARDESIHLFDCREQIQSNFNWQEERIPETFLLSPKHTRSKSKKGAAMGRVAVQHA